MIERFFRPGERLRLSARCGGLSYELAEQLRHPLERVAVLRDVVPPAEVTGVAVPDQDSLGALPDQNSQWQLETDPRVAAHQRGAGARVAKDDDLLICKLHVRLTSGSRMVEAGKHPQTAPLDAFHQPLDDGDVVRAASANEQVSQFSPTVGRTAPRAAKRSR